MIQIQNYINGQLINSKSGNYLDNFEPATGQIYSQIPDSNEADLELAVSAARSAQSTWANTSAEKRAQILCKLAGLIDDNADELAKAEAIDNGKPLAFAKSP